MMNRSLPLNSLSASFLAKIATTLAATSRSFNNRPSISKNLLVSYHVAPGKQTRGRTRSALELHARYFDPDRDEAVTPKQTLKGMTDLGLPWLMAAPLTLVINGFLGFLTRKKASLSISVPHIARGKHPFESGVFGPDGKLDEGAFAELFLAPNARHPRDRVTYGELRALVLRKGDPKMPFGPLGSLAARIFSAAEVFTLFCLAADCQKLVGDRVLPAMSQKNLRRFYEGRLFPVLARRRRILSARAEL